MVRIGHELGLPHAPSVEDAQAQVDRRARESDNPSSRRNGRWLLHVQEVPGKRGSIASARRIRKRENSPAEPKAQAELAAFLLASLLPCGTHVLRARHVASAPTVIHRTGNRDAPHPAIWNLDPTRILTRR